MRITGFGVDATLLPVAVTAGVLDVPKDPGQVGWWTGGALPGSSRGSVVLAGHVNYAGRTGALAVLAQVRPGQLITVDEPGHPSLRYAMRAVRSYPKSSGIPASAFSRDGPAQLVLITCGGPFDPSSGNYLDNIVGYADPATG